MPKRGGGKRAGRRAPAPAPQPLQEEEWDSDEEWEDEGGGLPREAMSVVKVLCTHAEPNYSLPWQMRKQNQSSSTGFVIDLKRRWILTNAHSVEHYTQVRLKKRGSEKKHMATVLAIGRECDIALLTVADDAFWEEPIDAVEFGPLPQLQEDVIVVGYPIGGETISVTSGVVSRVEVTSYVHGRDELIGVQIDAAINSGNSGGPAFNDAGQCIGIAFQSMAGTGEGENIGYVIPTPIVEHFMKDYIKEKRYSGFPALGISWQPMESPHMREAYQMGDRKGVLVRIVPGAGASAGILKKQDVLLTVEGKDIAGDGTVQFREDERIAWSYVVSCKHIGDTIKLLVWRDGKEVAVKVKLKARPTLVPIHLSGLPPSFFITAGLVFVSCSEPYLQDEYGDDYQYDAPVVLLERMLYGHLRNEGEEVVVLSQVLNHDVNEGYEEFRNAMVHAVNGTKVDNLRHFAGLCMGATSEFLRFDLEDEQVIVLKREEAERDSAEILKRHCIPAAMSEDLRPTRASEGRGGGSGRGRGGGRGGGRGRGRGGGGDGGRGSVKPDKARLASQRSGGTAAAVSPAADEVAAQGSKAAAGAGSNKNKKQRNRRAKNKQESVAPAPKQRQEVPDE
jgi:S1-C subfamily serine protease